MFKSTDYANSLELSMIKLTLGSIYGVKPHWNDDRLSLKPQANDNREKRKCSETERNGEANVINNKE